MASDNHNVNPTWARRSAFVGAIAWLFLLLPTLGDSREVALIERILLLGILIIVPLGLSLVSVSSKKPSGFYKLAIMLQPFGAAGVVLSFFLKPGMAAAAATLVWIVVAVFIALYGLGRLLRPELWMASELSIAAGLIYLPVGAGWLVMSRLGVQPIGFGDTIVLLTAVHFHFAGFAAPILAGLAGRRLSTSKPVVTTYRFAVLGVIVGTPLVAAGITFSPLLALTGAVVISLGLVLLALLTVVWVIPSLKSLAPKILLLVSSISTVPAMILACLYAYSIVFKTLIVDIPEMAMTHGVINAFGFALCGLLGWAIVEVRFARDGAN